MKCDYIGCKNEATYSTRTETPYTIQSTNYYCEKHSHDWMKRGLTAQGKIMGIEFTTTATKIK
jgi:uncharacterized protein YuzE